ncbi:hypothetical protein JZ751_005742, partial [Albula glossodonta]
MQSSEVLPVLPLPSIMVKPPSPRKEMTVADVMLSLREDIPEAPKFKSFMETSSGNQSVTRLEDPGAVFCVGDTLNVLVEMKDFNGKPKTYGGDFILARIHSPELKASASGVVTDLHNGSYRVSFTLFWSGTVQVSVLLIHSAEAVQVLWRERKGSYWKVLFVGTFIKGDQTETSQCGPMLKTTRPLCEYVDKREGEYYACIKPPTLPCSSLNNIKSHNSEGPFLTQDEDRLLERKNIGVQIKNSFPAVQVISCDVTPAKPSEKCLLGKESPIPTGYFYQNRWFSTVCQQAPFLSQDTITKCLTGKRFYLWGDSTIRQWMEYLRTKVEGLTHKDEVGNWLPLRSFNYAKSIALQWKRHNPPWIGSRAVSTKGFVYISRELDDVVLGGGRQDAIVISIGQHFRAFPLEYFIHRLLNIRRAILRLQARSPETMVFIKLENTREFTTPMLRMSDTYGHLQNLAQRKVFKGMRVVIVDAWDMSVAANTFSIHPN